MQRLYLIWLLLLSVCLAVQAPKNLQATEGSSKVSGAVYMAGQKHLDLLLLLGLLSCVAHMMPHMGLLIQYYINAVFTYM